MVNSTLRIATRKSPLALWQANFVGVCLKTHWPDLSIEFLPLVTSGDRFTKDKLQALGGKGLFVKELEEALLDKRADLAVHSMKDVPVHLPEGLEIAAFCSRDNPLDALICEKSKSIQELPQGSIVGTTSLRRQSQLLALRPDLKIKPLRGNIHTRLSKWKQGEYDAIILAAAGLERMNISNYSYHSIGAEWMLPACGQGILGIECRSEDTFLKNILLPLNDLISFTCIKAERYVNAQLGGNCHVPLGAYCSLTANHQLHLRAKVLAIDGTQSIYEECFGEFNESILIAQRCVTNLLNKGAKILLNHHE